MSDPTRIQQAIRTCSDALFTGILRVYAKQADGEIWLLSGIVERIRFGVSIGDDATARLFASTVSRLEVVPCLPNPSGGFKKGHPKEGVLGTTRPVDLLRFCETHALTCKVLLESGGSKGFFVYRLGELVSVGCDPGTDRAVAKMLEWSDGTFRFELPQVDLPPLATDDAPPSRARPETDYPPPSVAPASIPPPISLEDQAARLAAADEARKRRAEEVETKHRTEEQRVVPPPAESKSKRRPAERAPNRAQRRAELKKQAADDAASGRSMVVRVRRVTTEVALISVPITGAVTKADAQGQARVDPEALFAEASRLAKEGDARWQKEGEPRIEPHSEQPPLLESVDLVRRG